MNPIPESPTLPLHLTEPQYRWLQNAARFLADETGCVVTESSIVLRIMDYGIASFEKEMQELRAKSNEGRKRFQRLHLAYSRVEPPAARPV